MIVFKNASFGVLAPIADDEMEDFYTKFQFNFVIFYILVKFFNYAVFD